MIVYFGADSGCGCTMTAQSTAEYLSNMYPNKKVLMLSLSGYTGCDYTQDKFDYGIDDIQIKLKSHVLTCQELESLCSVRKNLFMLRGSRDLRARKEYMPEDISEMIGIAQQEFDYIIADAGCSVDLGMGLGALKCGGLNILVATQSQRAFSRHGQKENIFNMLGIEFEGLLINKFVSKHFLPTEKIVRESYRFSSCYVIEYSDYGMQAEEQKITLDSLDKEYKKQISNAVKNMMEQRGISEHTGKKKRSGLLGLIGGGNGGI